MKKEVSTDDSDHPDAPLHRRFPLGLTCFRVTSDARRRFSTVLRWKASVPSAFSHFPNLTVPPVEE